MSDDESSDEIMYFYNVYVVGKNTPNKFKLIQMLGENEEDEKSFIEHFEGKLETKRDGTKYTIFNVTEEEVDSLKKGKRANFNHFYYVYDVDDRETFEKFEKIHQKLREEFNNIYDDKFILYGINCNIKNERSVSFEELMTTAVKNKCHYFELQEFNMKKIYKRISFGRANNQTVYNVGSEKSGYKEVFEEEIVKRINEFEYFNQMFLPTKIEEMEPLEKIIEKAIEERNELGINFIYSPYDRETFTSIVEYVSKCPNLQNYYKLELFMYENKLIKGEEKGKEVTSLEVKRCCKKFGIEYEYTEFGHYNRHGKIPDGCFSFKEFYNFDLEKYSLKPDLAKKFYSDVSLHKYSIYFATLHTDSPIFVNSEHYNYIVACDSSGFRGKKLKEKENFALQDFHPYDYQHYIRFEGNEIEEILKLYFEFQEPAKETIHIFGNNGFEEVLLDTNVIGFIKDEECKLVRFNNHIYKYKVEFHEEYSFNKDMKYNLFFVNIDDESGIEMILDEMETNGTNNFHIFVQNRENIPKDEEQSIIERFKIKFNETSDKIELFKLSDKIELDEKSNEFKFEDEENTYKAIENIFIRLTKGEEQENEYEGYEESGCCRV